MADLLKLTPVLGLRRGDLGPLGALWGRTGVLDKLLRYVRRRVDPDKTYRVSVAHADCEDDARYLLERLTELIPRIDNTYFGRVGAAIGAHTGRSGLAVCVQEYTPPGA